MDKGEYLRKQGWVCVQRGKVGMVRIIRWSLPGTDWQGVNQGIAYKVARDSEKWHKQHQEPDPR